MNNDIQHEPNNLLPGHPLSNRKNRREETRYFSLDITEGSSINNTINSNTNSYTKPVATQFNRDRSSNNLNANEMSTLQERWKNHQSKNLGTNVNNEDSLRLEVDVNNYRSPRHADENFSPAFSRISNASTIKQKNSSETVEKNDITILQNERNTQSFYRDDKPAVNNRESSFDFQNHNIEKDDEEEEDHQDNSFHLGLESMETDLSSITDTMYSLDTKYPSLNTRNSLRTSKSYNHYDKYEEEQHDLETSNDIDGNQSYTSFNNQLQSQSNINDSDNYNANNNKNTLNEDQLVYGARHVDTSDNVLIEDRDDEDTVNLSRRQLRRIASTSSQFDPQMDRLNTSNVHNSRIDRSNVGRIRKSSMDRSNGSNYSNRRNLHHKGYLNNSATLSTEESSQFISQEWTMIAVNVAASILEAGECKEIAEAATAAILSVGGSGRLDRSSALEAAAEASTAVLSAGCNQITAATVAVTVLKSCEMVPSKSSDNSALSPNSCASQCTTPKSHGGSKCSTPRTSGNMNKNKFLPSLSENESSEVSNITEVEPYEANETHVSHSCNQGTFVQNKNRGRMSNRRAEAGTIMPSFSLMDRNDSQSSSISRNDNTQITNNEQQSITSNSKSGSQSSLIRKSNTNSSKTATRHQPHQEYGSHGQMPSIIDAISNLFVNTKQSIKNVLESENYDDFLVGCKSPTSLQNHHSSSRGEIDQEASNEIYSHKPAMLSYGSSTLLKESYNYVYGDPALDKKSNPTTTATVDISTKSTSSATKTIEGSKSSAKKKKKTEGRKKLSKKSSKRKVLKEEVQTVPQHPR